MSFADIPLLSMLKSKMHYVTQRQTLLAQNVANADTPGYAPRDMKPFTFAQAMQRTQSANGLHVTRTNAAHLSSDASVASGPVGGGDTQDAADSEERLDGNHVVLEDQMMKLTQAKMDYDTAVGFYQQSLQLLQTAIKKPGS
jgi:flagellar basal-body rod protein FlgB